MTAFRIVSPHLFANAFLFPFCHSYICYFWGGFTYLFLFCLIDSKYNATCSQ